jgi:circadian clock protein KaiB
MVTAEWHESTDAHTVEVEAGDMEGLAAWLAAGAAPARRRELSGGRQRAVARDHSQSQGIPTEPRARVGLMLYMSGGSPHSQRALDVLRGVIENCEPGLVKLTVVDLAMNPRAGADDRIAYTPTLVKVFPAPKAWVVGNLENPQLVLDLLREYVVDCNDGRGNGHEHLSAKKPSIQ